MNKQQIKKLNQEILTIWKNRWTEHIQELTFLCFTVTPEAQGVVTKAKEELLQVIQQHYNTQVAQLEVTA